MVIKEGKEAIVGGEVDRLMSHLADCEVQGATHQSSSVLVITH